METETDTFDPSDLLTSKDDFAKAMIGTAAGFIAGKLVQRAYDQIVIAYRLRNR